MSYQKVCVFYYQELLIMNNHLTSLSEEGRVYGQQTLIPHVTEIFSLFSVPPSFRSTIGSNSIYYLYLQINTLVVENQPFLFLKF